MKDLAFSIETLAWEVRVAGPPPIHQASDTRTYNGRCPSFLTPVLVCLRWGDWRISCGIM